PVLTAIGITLALVGVTTYIELTIAGGLLALGCVVRWIKGARHELDELPLDRLAARRRCGAPARGPAPRAVPLSPHAGACRDRTDGSVFGPAAHDIADREDPNRLPSFHDDQVAKAAAHHRRGSLLQRPLGRGEHRVTREVLGDNLRVGVLPVAERGQDVALGDDPRPGAVWIDHDRRADLAPAHEPGDGTQRVTRAHRQDRRTHPLANLHGRSFPVSWRPPGPPPCLQRLAQCNT